MVTRYQSRCLGRRNAPRVFIAASGAKNELGTANKKECVAVEEELLPSDPEDSDKAPFSLF